MTDRIKQIRERLENCETEAGARKFDAFAHLDIAFLLAELESTQQQLSAALKMTTQNTVEHMKGKER